MAYVHCVYRIVRSGKQRGVAKHAKERRPSGEDVGRPSLVSWSGQGDLNGVGGRPLVLREGGGKRVGRGGRWVDRG